MMAEKMKQFIELKITFETQDEIDAFYALFAQPEISGLLRELGINHSIISQSIMGEVNNYNKFAEKIIKWIKGFDSIQQKEKE